MKRTLVAAVFSGLAAAAARAETIESVYTDLDIGRDCVMISTAEEGVDAADYICSGYLGFPVLLFYGDLRESVFYGFPPEGKPAWESFDAFNSTGPKIEWRIAVNGDQKLPFATIHRWFVNDVPEDPEKKTEVLVVEKVSQLDKREGCALGYVVATGNPKANETARKIADGQARDFSCGADEPVLVGGAVQVPSFTRP